MPHLDLPTLQDRCKRDASLYKEEFLLQLQHFKSLLQIFKLKPSNPPSNFGELISFLSHLCTSYPAELNFLPTELCNILQENQTILPPELRLLIVKSLILIRNKNLVKLQDLTPIFFKLFECKDKELRQLIFQHLVTDIKSSNKKQKNPRLNNYMQNFLISILHQPPASQGSDNNSLLLKKKAIDILVLLYHKKIWDDAKTVNGISSGVFCPEKDVAVAALHFFLGNKTYITKSDESPSKPSNLKKPKELLFKFGISKKTKAKSRKLEAAMAKIRKEERSKNEDDEEEESTETQINFSAIEQIYDPQGYSERLFSVLKKSSIKFDLRLLMMNLLARLIFAHKIILTNWYPFVQKYLQPKQENITLILAILAQSCHDLIPPEILEPIIRLLADNFVSDRSSDEVVSIGINTIREICARCPLSMNADLLSDLVEYRKSKDKGVVVAARSLINLYREVYPALLPKKERGKDHDINVQPLQYGQVNVPASVAGIELLEDKIREGIDPNEDFDPDNDDEYDDDEDQWQNVEEDSNGESDLSDNDEDGWVSVDDGADEDNDDGWISVQSDQEDQAEEMNTDVPEQKLHLDAQKILTPEEWAVLQKLKKTAPEKRRLSNDSLVSDIVDPSVIESYQKKRKRTKEEKVEAAMAGKEGREGFKKFKKDKGGGTTNEEKLKNKPFMLTKFKRSVTAKGKRSQHQQQRVKTAHKEKMRKMKRR